MAKDLVPIGSTKYYNWFSENAFIWPEGSFQYGENVNIRDDVSGVQLSSFPEERSAADFPSWSTSITAYCLVNIANEPTLVTFYRKSWWPNPFTSRINLTWTSETTEWSTGTTDIDQAVRFWELNSWVREQRIFWFAQNEIWIIDTATWSASTIDPSDTIDWVTENWSDQTGRITPLVYSNSVLIVGHGNALWRYVPVASAELPVWWSIIRKYKAEDEIIWLTLQGNYLKVTISDWDINTLTYFLAGTFDVEDWWVVEVIDWNNMLWFNATTLENIDYYMMRSGYDASVLYVYRLNWYTKEKVFRTLRANWQNNQLEYFTSGALYEQPFPVKRGIMYVPAADGVWTFGINKFWQFIVNKDWTLWGNWSARKWAILWDYLYVYYSRGGDDVEVRYYIEYRNNWYTTEPWILIDRIMTGWVVGSWKENIQMNIGYELDKNTNSPWNIEVYIRPNRIDRTVADGWFLVATITDANSMVEEIYLSTDNFRADRNCLEYKLVLNRGSTATVSPIVYDVSLFYNPNVDRPWWLTYSP